MKLALVKSNGYAGHRIVLALAAIITVGLASQSLAQLAGLRRCNSR